MNWKNPVRVTAYIGWEIFNGAAFLVGEWVRYGVRASQMFLAIPPTAILFFGGVWFAVWSFVRRPFPALETVPLLGEHGWLNPPGPAKRCRQTNQYCNTISQPLTS